MLIRQGVPGQKDGSAHMACRRNRFGHIFHHGWQIFIDHDSFDTRRSIDREAESVTTISSDDRKGKPILDNRPPVEEDQWSACGNDGLTSNEIKR